MRNSRQSNRITVRSLGVMFVLVLVSALGAACGGDSPAGDGGGDGEKVIRFNFAPDETMQYLIDTGTLADMEKEWGVKLEMTTTWDEFAFFAGGHGDIVSTATYELPSLEEKTGIETVTFGKYARAKMQILVPADSPYQTMTDLKGKKVAVGDAGGTTAVWAAMIKEQEGLDLQANGGDFEMILGEHATNAELVVRGDVDACVCTPYLAVNQLRTGELRGLYDDASAADFYEQNFGGEDVLLENVFTANKEWYDSHPYEVAFFLALWEKGLQLRAENLDEIVEEYPADFSVESDEDITWMQGWLRDHKPVLEHPYLDDAWVDGETQLYETLEDAGSMSEDAPEPGFSVVTEEDVEEEAPTT